MRKTRISPTTKLRNLDIFGHPIGVTYKGERAYKTYLGAFFTILMAVSTLIYAAV